MNKDYFEIIDKQEKAYYLGFILSDGNISKDINRIQFCINEKDVKILEKLKKEIDSKNSIRYYSNIDKRTGNLYKTIMFQFSSEKIKKDLENKGLYYNKSSSFQNMYNIPNEFLNSFLRGLIDGDGSINTKGVQITSTFEFLNSLNKKIFKSPCLLLPINRDKNVWKLYIQAHNTYIDFLDYIYSNSKIHLERKYLKYLELKNKNINARKESKFKDNFVY